MKINEIVSIIVPVYNVEKYLDQCISSIVNQTYCNIEIILVNDGSTDNSEKICNYWKNKDDRITLINKENAGLGMARNTGIDYAHGSYLMFVDSDDYIDNDAVSIFLNTILNTNADVVYCDYQKFFSDGSYKNVGNKSYKLFNKEEIFCGIFVEMLSSPLENKNEIDFSMSACMCIYSKKIIDEFHIRFQSERLLISEDLIFQFDFLQHSNKAVTLPNRLYHYRLTNNSLTTTFRLDRFEKNIHLYNFLYSILSKKYPIEIFYDRLNKMLLGRMRGCIIDLIKSDEKNKLAIIKSYCNNTTIVNLLKRYPFKSVPFSKGIYNFLIYKKYSFLVYLITKLHVIMSNFWTTLS